jgi:hypothetical protein
LKKANVLCVGTIFLVLMTAFLISASAYPGQSCSVTVEFERNGVPMSGVAAEVYTLKNGWPAELVSDLQTGMGASATLRLATGEYCVEAYTSGESGYHGYANISVEPNSGMDLSGRFQSKCNPMRIIAIPWILHLMSRL